MTRSSEPSPVLITPAYAPASLSLPWYRRRIFRRGVALVLLFAAVLYLVYSFHHLPQQWKVYRLQQRCMNYTAPPDQIVFSELPQDIAALRAVSSEYHGLPRYVPLTNPPAVGHFPTCYQRLDPNSLHPVLYLGQRTNSLGETRLICIRFSGWAPLIKNEPDEVLRTYTFEMYTWSAPSMRGRIRITQRSAGGGSEFIEGVPASVKNPRFFAGQSDPNDASRFTIKYELDGKTGTFVGIFDAKGDVILKLRDGPLKSPPAARSTP